MVLNLEVIGFSAGVIGDPKQLLLTDNRGKEGSTISLQGSSIANASGEKRMEATSVRPAQSIPTATVSNPLTTDSPNGRPVVSPLYEPAPNYSNKGPIAKNQAPARILPIDALTPYVGRWAIKGRVTAKSDLRRFHNARGDGKVFSFDLLDGDGGEIRATCFNLAADQFMDRIEVGKLYMVSKGTLKAAQRSFNHLRHDYEMTLEHSSIVELLSEEDISIPQQHFKFTPISAIEDAEEKSMVDVLGVVVGISPTNTILLRNGTETQKRTVQLRDTSGCSVELTMWGSFCAKEGRVLQEICDSGKTPILAVKAGRISAFSGKSVGTISTTQLIVDPDLPEAQQLRAWFDSEGKAKPFQSISREGGAGINIETRKTVAQIKEEGLGRSGKPDWIAVRGRISFVKTDKFCYTACPLMIGDRQCNRKVLNRGDGMWHCDHCEKAIPECAYRYLLSFQVQDHTGVTWVTAFQEVAEEIVGVSAKELHLWKEDGDERFEDTIQKLLFAHKLFKLKVKEDNYNDEMSVKCSVLRAEQLSFEAESKVLLESIRGLTTDNLWNGTNFVNGGMRAYGSVPGPVANGVSSPSKYIGGRFSGGVSGGGGSSSLNSPCFKCGKTGHWAKDCPNQGTGRFR